MSREWRRVASDTLCGLCVNKTIPKGEPALFISLPMVKRERIRCQSCAGESAPELPARVVLAGVQEMAQNGFTKASASAPGRTRGELKQAMRREWTPYAAEREAGEEG